MIGLVSDWIANGLAVWFDESPSSEERRQGTSVIVHIDEYRDKQAKAVCTSFLQYLYSRGNTRSFLFF
jgi:hypothetical protein